MNLLGILVLLASLRSVFVIPTDSVFEGRVHEDAPAGTDVTLHPEFELTLRKYRGCLLCVLRLNEHQETESSRSKEDQTQRAIDSHYFRYEPSELTLRTTRNMDRRVGEYYEVPMAAFCAGDSESVQWMVIVRVSQINRYAPAFDQRQYTFRISKKSSPGAVLGTVRAQDRDVVIYNSLVSYKLVNAEANDQAASTSVSCDLDIKTGAVRLTTFLSDIPTSSVSVPFEVEACDYGSPRKCGFAMVKVETVKVESPVNVTVVTSNTKYHILCWSQAPMTLEPDFYTLHIETMYGDPNNQSRRVLTKNVRSQSTNGTRHCTVIGLVGLKDGIDDGPVSSYRAVNYSILITAHLMGDEATSEPLLVSVTSLNTLSCDGTCLNNGTPACEALTNESSDSASFARQFNHDGQAYCVCTARFDGNLCQNERHCDEAISQSAYGRVSWNRTSVDAVAEAKCPFGPDSTIVTRTCAWNFTRDTSVWNAISGLEQCRTESQYFEATSLSGLNEKSTDTGGGRVLNGLAMLEQSGDAIAEDKQLADRMINFINATISMDFGRLPEREEMGSRIRKILMSYTEKLPLAPGDSSVLRSDNVIAAVAKVKAGVEPIPVNLGREAKLTIPRCVVDQAALSVSEPRISAVWLRDDKIFSFADKDKNVIDPGQRAVLIITVQGLDREEALIEPISFSLISPNLPVSRRRANDATCVYWQEEESKWSNRGVKTVNVDAASGSVHCETDHLTGFSILLDFEPGAKVDLEHRRKLNLLSWIGCVCSITTLLFTIVTYSLFPCLKRDHAGKILLNLCTSMLLLNVVFVLSSVRPRVHYSYNVCAGIGALLHYFTLSTLLWMGVEAAHMYQMLVHVFASTERLFMAKRCAVAWGIPLITVIGTLVANTDHYFDRDDDYCRLSSRYPAMQYGVYLAPACVILFVNCIGFGCVLKVLNQTNASTSIAKPKTHAGALVKYSTLVAQVRGALSVMVLLGVTWVLGAFAVGPVRLPFMYAFCALNSLQGFIIFLVRCLCYDEARRAWCTFLRTGKLKQQRGRAATIENRFWDSRSSSNQRRVRRTNTATSDTSNRPLTTFQNPEKVKKMNSVEQENKNFMNAGLDVEVSLIPRSWKYIDEPSSPAVGGR